MWGLEMAMLLATGTTLVALVVLVAWALPVYWFLKSRKRESLLSYSIAGAMPAVVLVPSFRPFGDDTVPDLILQAVTLGVIGALAALMFWRFRRRSRA
jgi:MFS superfamily sulfate permease-like transporter